MLKLRQRREMVLYQTRQSRGIKYRDPNHNLQVSDDKPTVNILPEKTESDSYPDASYQEAARKDRTGHLSGCRVSRRCGTDRCPREKVRKGEVYSSTFSKPQTGTKETCHVHDGEVKPSRTGYLLLVLASVKFPDVEPG